MMDDTQEKEKKDKVEKLQLLLVPQHSYVEINQQTKIWKGAYSCGMSPCRPVVVTNKKRTFMFFCHADALTKLNDVTHGVPAWLNSAYEYTKALDEIQVLIGEEESTLYGKFIEPVVNCMIDFYKKTDGSKNYNQDSLSNSGNLVIIPKNLAHEIAILISPDSNKFQKPYYIQDDMYDSKVFKENYDLDCDDEQSLRASILNRIPRKDESESPTIPPMPFFIKNSYIKKSKLEEILSKYLGASSAQSTLNTSTDDPEDYHKYSVSSHNSSTSKKKTNKDAKSTLNLFKKTKDSQTSEEEYSQDSNNSINN